MYVCRCLTVHGVYMKAQQHACSGVWLHAQKDCSVCSHTECTWICAHWLYANRYPCIRGRKEENLLMFLWIMFLGKTKKYWCLCSSTLLFCLSLRLSWSLLLQLASYYHRPKLSGPIRDMHLLISSSETSVFSGRAGMFSLLTGL